MTLTAEAAVPITAAEGTPTDESMVPHTTVKILRVLDTHEFQ